MKNRLLVPLSSHRIVIARFMKLYVLLTMCNTSNKKQIYTNYFMLFEGIYSNMDLLLDKGHTYIPKVGL
jgi:hypothetical protein